MRDPLRGADSWGLLVTVAVQDPRSKVNPPPVRGERAKARVSGIVLSLKSHLIHDLPDGQISVTECLCLEM